MFFFWSNATLNTYLVSTRKNRQQRKMPLRQLDETADSFIIAYAGISTENTIQVDRGDEAVNSHNVNHLTT